MSPDNDLSSLLPIFLILAVVLYVNLFRFASCVVSQYSSPSDSRRWGGVCYLLAWEGPL
jgi:hypothetical protein